MNIILNFNFTSLWFNWKKFAEKLYSMDEL